MVFETSTNLLIMCLFLAKWMGVILFAWTLVSIKDCSKFSSALEWKHSYKVSLHHYSLLDTFLARFSFMRRTELVKPWA